MNNPQENSISKFISAREREFEKEWRASGLHLGYKNETTEKFRQLHTASMTGLVDKIIGEIDRRGLEVEQVALATTGSQASAYMQALAGIRYFLSLEKKGLEEESHD